MKKFIEYAKKVSFVAKAAVTVASATILAVDSALLDDTLTPNETFDVLYVLATAVAVYFVPNKKA